MTMRLTKMTMLTAVSKRMLTALAGLGLVVSIASQPARALSEMEDAALEDVSGAGIAISLTNYQTGWGATSYLQAVGTAVTATDLLTPTLSQAFQRADAYWYGGTYSSTSAVRAWAGTCGAGIGNMGCPIGGLIAKFAPYDNPLLLRVFNYYQSPSGSQLLDYQGTAITSANPVTIFEVLGPTRQDAFKFSFWAELQVMSNVDGSGATRQGLLQSQVIMNNSKLTSDVNGIPGNNKIRLFQTTRSADPTFGIIWENHFQGDFRFSVNQQALSPGVAGLAPMFTDFEGFYARNLKVHVPMGQLFYQALIFDDTVAGKNASYNSAVNKGDFVIELTPLCYGTGCIPPAAVYNDFYGYSGSYTDGYSSAKSARYYETHGYFTIGNAGTNNNNTTAGALASRDSDTTDGVFFHAWHPTNVSAQFVAYAQRPDSSQYASVPNGTFTVPNTAGNYGAGRSVNAANLGDVAINGMLIHHFKMTTLGAAN